MSRLGGGLVALGVSVAILSAGVPAQACACGGFLLSEEESVTVSAEFAAIGWDGETERIVLSFGAKTNATDMALLIPTPSPATVSLVDAGLFDELEDFTAPRYERVDQWWPSWFPLGPEGATSGAPVQVRHLDSVDLGQVTADVLSATDADALADWLKENGYVMRDEIASALLPYVQQDWYYVAVKLNADDLSGELQPLDIEFSAKQLVYPMRLNVASEQPTLVQTYVFASHRMERTDSMGGDLRWAGPVESTDFINQTLVDMAGTYEFLTAWEQFFSDPAEQIVADMSFAAASSDTPYEEVIVLTRERAIFGVPAGPTLVFGGLILIGVLGGVTSRVRRNRQRLSRPVESQTIGDNPPTGLTGV